MTQKRYKLIIGIALPIALGTTAWATWAYQSSQNEIESLQNEVERLTQKKRELQKEIQSTFQEIVTTATESAASNADSKTVTLAEGPELTVEPKILDLGTIRKADGLRTDTFNLKNTGGSDLLLKTVLSSCGCTTVEVKNVTVAPGANHELPVTYDPNYFGPSLELGPVEKWIAIMSNDSERPITKVYLKANVIP